MVQFDLAFFNSYSVMIEKGMKNLQKSNGVADLKAATDFMDKIILEIQVWVRVVFFTVLRFYRLNIINSNTNISSFGLDVRKDLLLNMVTSLVMMD